MLSNFISWCFSALWRKSPLKESWYSYSDANNVIVKLNKIESTNHLNNNGNSIVKLNEIENSNSLNDNDKDNILQKKTEVEKSINCDDSVSSWDEFSSCYDSCRQAPIQVCSLKNLFGLSDDDLSDFSDDEAKIKSFNSCDDFLSFKQNSNLQTVTANEELQKVEEFKTVESKSSSLNVEPNKSSISLEYCFANSGKSEFLPKDACHEKDPPSTSASSLFGPFSSKEIDDDDDEDMYDSEEESKKIIEEFCGSVNRNKIKRIARQKPAKKVIELKPTVKVSESCKSLSTVETTQPPQKADSGPNEEPGYIFKQIR